VDLAVVEHEVRHQPPQLLTGYVIDARVLAREAYRVPSGVNNILVINRVITPGRITALLVRESLGF